MVLTTAIPQLALTLTSVYLGAGAGQALATYLIEAPRREPELAVQRVDARAARQPRPPALPARAHRRTAAPGKLADAAVAIDVPDVALAAADELFEALD